MNHNRVLGSLVLLVIGLCPSVAVGQHYTQTNLVSNTDAAPVHDANLRNAWGLTHGPATPWWISDNFNGLSTVYNTSTTPTTILSNIVVTVPDAAGNPGHPTGIVFNGSATDFLLAPGKQAIFIWVTEDGTIDGWNPGVNATKAVVVFPPPNKPVHDAVYKGATIAEIGGKKYLLVANFKSGQIDVFDSAFQPVDIGKHMFRDQKIRKGFAPFNVQGIGPNVYVTYAKQDDEGEDDVPGAGLGFVDVFRADGELLLRLEHGDWLNAPWGVTLAPGDFGEFSHALLVGNFGDGTIAAFNPVSGDFIGNMLTPAGSKVAILGLWALSFGNGSGGPSGPGNALFFTAGPNDEMDGLFGKLTPIPSELNEGDEQ
ncbi:MAG TPA: TIGR03118 family protein [Vicinamibacterales bacterium]|nr:TIGR03118 family protein [Vicinamibacterales bacterium]